MSYPAYLVPVRDARASLSPEDRIVENERWEADVEEREARDNLIAAKARYRAAKRNQKKAEAAWYATAGSKAVSAACAVSIKLEREEKSIGPGNPLVAA